MAALRRQTKTPLAGIMTGKARHYRESEDLPVEYTLVVFGEKAKDLAGCTGLPVQRLC